MVSELCGSSPFGNDDQKIAIYANCFSYILLVNFYPYLLSLLKELKEQRPFEDAKVL